MSWHLSRVPRAVSFKASREQTLVQNIMICVLKRRNLIQNTNFFDHNFATKSLNFFAQNKPITPVDLATVKSFPDHLLVSTNSPCFAHFRMVPKATRHLAPRHKINIYDLSWWTGISCSNLILCFIAFLLYRLFAWCFGSQATAIWWSMKRFRLNDNDHVDQFHTNCQFCSIFVPPPINGRNFLLKTIAHEAQLDETIFVFLD